MVVPVAGFALLNVVVKVVAVSAPVFAFYRLWLGVAVMLLVVAAARRRVRWEWLAPSLPAGVLFGLNILLFVSALKLTAVADVMIIGALQPALTLLVAGPLFGERITGRDLAWTAVSVGGIVLVAVGSSGSPAWSLRGDLLAVGALLAWTAFFLVSKRVRARVAATEYMTGATMGAAVLATPVALAIGDPLTALRWQDWGWLALFVTGAQTGHVTIAWAHAHVDVSVSSLLLLAEPPIAAAAALAFLGEPLSGLSIVGGLMVLGAMGVVVRRATRAGVAGEIAPSEPAPP
jgi:drug/metabolite transporter (DMT)-like permease